MACYLITLSLGPVQSMIGAARRTRDLWCGSWLLSEAARAAAAELHATQPGCLIFPYPEDPKSDLRPQQRPGDAANIANILRAELDLTDAGTARALCEQARSAAIARLAVLGESAREEIDRLGIPLRAEVWQAQIGDILEGFAAWVKVEPGEGGYAQASGCLGGALAARKATRDFRACTPLTADGLPKSSLDGALETVLPEDLPIGHRARRKLGLSKGEQLDALAVAKRLAGDTDQFTAYSRIAADPWIARLTAPQQQLLRGVYEPLVGMELATRVNGNQGIYSALPFDAQMLFGFRLDNALSAGRDQARDPQERKALNALRRCLGDIAREPAADGAGVGAPVPYAVILKADGDRMGVMLARADSAAGSRAVSRALHAFASSVRSIVRSHRGHAIYAGGDDVLALVPLVNARDCARALSDAFQVGMNPITVDLSVPDDERPTLSVGLGIGHLMEPLGALRARADRAEQAAKGDATGTPRNALAIVLGIRSGGELHWRAQWHDGPAFDALARLTEAFASDQLPTRAAYDLRGIDLRLDWLRGDDSATARGMRAGEVARLLDRARSDGGTRDLPDEVRRLLLKRAEAQPLAELAETLIIARWLSARTATDLGERV